jgi:hypothetical protein
VQDRLRVEMAKKMKTRQELADLVLREARASGKCADLHRVYVIGPVNRGHSNWDIGTSSDGPNLISGPCRINYVIVGRLQATYDLSGD